MEKDIDIVLTYVDDTDPIWILSKLQFSTADKNYKQFRSWNNLQYIFRGIQKNMDFVRNVYLVVSNIEQVPSWINLNEVHVILHKDIIPEKYLPTFNSTTIEMFLHKILGLSEKFIYFNDDLFPIRKLESSYFFNSNGFPLYKLVMWFNGPTNTFRMQCYNSYMLAKKLSNCNKPNSDNCRYYYVSHSANPMLKSTAEEVFRLAESDITHRISKFREPFNYTQYLFPLYNIMTGRYLSSNGNYTYVHSNVVHEFEDALGNDKCKIMCINDVGINESTATTYKQQTYSIDSFESLRDYVNMRLLEILPEKSKYEI